MKMIMMISMMQKEAAAIGKDKEEINAEDLATKMKMIMVIAEVIQEEALVA
jgi:hypothetical protein